MEPKLKRDLWIAGIGICAAAACLPALFLAMMHLPADFAAVCPPLFLLHVYLFLCLFSLVWVGVQVIWERPWKERRLFLFLLWLLLYPVTCIGWYVVCWAGFFLIYHIH